MKVMLSMQDLHNIWAREYRNEYIDVVWDLNSGRVRTNESAGENAWLKNYTNYDQARKHSGKYRATIRGASVSTLLFGLIDTAHIFEDTVEIY